MEQRSCRRLRGLLATSPLAIGHFARSAQFEMRAYYRLRSRHVACTVGHTVPSTDRAFRALARVEPHIIWKVLAVAVPELVEDGPFDQGAVDDPKLDLPPPVEADLVLRRPQSVLHVEAQGYGDTSFSERVFRYHFLSDVALPRPGRADRRPSALAAPASQRLGRIEEGNVSVRVHTVVLAELPAMRSSHHPTRSALPPVRTPAA